MLLSNDGGINLKIVLDLHIVLNIQEIKIIALGYFTDVFISYIVFLKHSCLILVLFKILFQQKSTK